MSRTSDQTVLLFFSDFESDSLVPGDRYLKRVARPVMRRYRKGKSVSGFQMWFERLVTALRSSGSDVRVNDRRTAKQNPGLPVGLVGYPHLLDQWRLPNPAVLGPCLYDHPEQAPHLLDDPRYRRYLVTCDWMFDLFATRFPTDRLARWYAGMDLAEWPDSSSSRKSYDVLVYDKIRFDRDRVTAALLEPLLDRLRSRDLRFEVITYGAYNHSDFRRALTASRSMIFLCEHETQGMAYQEAMAMNVPIFAWDPGRWADPARLAFELSDVPTTSVPYFSDECGATFSDLTEFDAELDRFVSALDDFDPRGYVQRELSMAGSATAYLQAYDPLRS